MQIRYIPIELTIHILAYPGYMSDLFGNRLSKYAFTQPITDKMGGVCGLYIKAVTIIVAEKWNYSTIVFSDERFTIKGLFYMSYKNAQFKSPC